LNDLVIGASIAMVYRAGVLWATDRQNSNGEACYG